jgi:hypothetical protein
LWDRSDLERLYARLEDEYELAERVETLNRKLEVVADTADTFADIIDNPPLAAVGNHRRAGDRLRDRNRVLADLRRARALRASLTAQLALGLLGRVVILRRSLTASLACGRLGRVPRHDDFPGLSRKGTKLRRFRPQSGATLTMCKPSRS